MAPADLRELLNVLQLLGAPLVVLYAIHRGWLATRREVELLQDALATLQQRHASLESQMREEQQSLKRDLESTRTQLIDLLAAEHCGHAR
jgi:hypothetical protein